MKKVALVTGGTSGIGEATAKELARRGWEVAAMTRSHGEKEFRGDVGEDADCRRVVKAVLDKWGRIDALVNCAGTTKFVGHADLEGLSAEDFEKLRTRHPEIETVVRQATARRDATRMAVVQVAQGTIAAGQPSGRVRIGRASDNDMVFSSSLVSGHHAEIEFEGDVARVRDLDSTNGTFVNGNRIQAVDLNDGDEIQIGDQRFTFDRRAIQAPLSPPAQPQSPR